MNIKQAKTQINNAIKSYFSKDDFGNYKIPIERQRPIFLMGPPGIGKTAIMEQIASELGVGLVSYSMTHHTRQSALGLPFIKKRIYDGREYSVSEYTMSEIIASVYDMMESVGVKEGILFLDEINCVSETLAPAMLQFLQYKIFGRHRIPDGWIVVTAGNPPEYISIPSGVGSIGHSAFENCSSLTSISIPSGVARIENSAFKNCYGLVSISIPSSVTNIGNSLFENCTSLTSIVLPEGVTSIGDFAFYRCKKLSNIRIPDSVAYIGENILADCSGLENITWPSSLAKELPRYMPETKKPIILHISDISNVSAKFRPNAAAGFAEDACDCIDTNGRKYLRYIKSNVTKIAEFAAMHPSLFYLMLKEKLVAAKDLGVMTDAAQKSKNTELIAAILNYGSSSISEKDKTAVQQKKDEREMHVTDFIFNTEKIDVLNGKNFVVTGKLKTFTSRDELKECLMTCGASLTETLSPTVDYLITNTPDSGTAKNKKAIDLGIKRITEAQFNEMIGRIT